MANNIIDEIKRRNKEGVILKLDFEKAYDCVNWDFLPLVMSKWGLGLNVLSGFVSALPQLGSLS